MRITVFSRGEAGAPLIVSGDARIEGSASFASGLTAQGNLVVARNAKVAGNLRVGRTFALEAGARVEGDVTVEGEAYVAEGAGISGKLVCRRLLFGAPPRSLEEEAEQEPEGPAAVALP